MSIEIRKEIINHSFYREYTSLTFYCNNDTSSICVGVEVAEMFIIRLLNMSVSGI